jgi:hypothetical protein
MDEELETAYRLMETERNRWRLCAIQLAEQLHKRLPNLPDLEYFYELLDETDEQTDPYA